MGRHPSKYISVVGTRKIYNWVENMGLIEKMFLDPPLFFGVLVWVEKRFEVLWQLKTCFLNPL